MNEKDRRLAEFCKRNGHDGVWIRRRSNIAWVTDGADVHCDTGTALGVASLLWTPRKKVVLTNNIESARLAEEEFDDEWQIETSPWWESGPAPEGRLATDYPDDVIAELRFSLTTAEVARARELGADTADVLAGTMQRVRPGETEHEVAGALVSQLRRREIHCPVVMVAADERITRYRHPIPTSKPIEKTVMAVVCTQRRGLIVCLTRLVHFGRLPDELRRRHAAVCRVDEAMHAATVPGARWCDILREATRAYEATGYADEWKQHHQGGPMGYEPRDFLVTPSETRTVQTNQLVGWNPSIAGTKSEDTILSGGEVITTMPDWPMCGTRPDILRRTKGAAAA